MKAPDCLRLATGIYFCEWYWPDQDDRQQAEITLQDDPEYLAWLDTLDKQTENQHEME